MVAAEKISLNVHRFETWNLHMLDSWLNIWVGRLHEAVSETRMACWNKRLEIPNFPKLKIHTSASWSWINRDLKHWRRMGRQRPTGSDQGELNATTHARLVVQMLSRTWKPVVCRPAVNMSKFTRIFTPKSTFVKEISSQLRIRLSTYLFFVFLY